MRPWEVPASMTLIEPDSLDDVINPQCDEAEANLTVESADAMVLHSVEKKYQERRDTGHEGQCRHDGKNLSVRPLQ